MPFCSYCNCSGSNMKQCSKCRQIWCETCIMQAGKVPFYPPYPGSTNVCPFCGERNTVQTAPRD